VSSHFTPEAWVDLARGVAEPENEHALRAHLKTGCLECARQLEQWRSVEDLARREPHYEPPAATVRLVERSFDIWGPSRRPSPVVRFLQLAFDSFRQPALEGVRTSGQPTRQLLYESDRFAVDVRLEKESGSRRVSLVGQILDRVHPARRLAGAQVRLDEAGARVAQTTANAHGEFQLSFEPAADLWLSVEVGGTKALAMPLAGFPGTFASSP
jgi:hypothetical protein